MVKVCCVPSHLKIAVLFLSFITFFYYANGQSHKESWLQKQCGENEITSTSKRVDVGEIYLPFTNDFINKKSFQNNLNHIEKKGPFELKKVHSIEDLASIYNFEILNKKTVSIDDFSYSIYYILMSDKNQELNEHTSWYLIFVNDIGLIFVQENYNIAIENTSYQLNSSTLMNKKTLQKVRKIAKENLTFLECW